LRLVLVAPFARAPKSTTRLRVLPLARALAARGHDVTVLVPPYDNPLEAGETYTSGAAKVEALRVDAGVPEQSWRQAIAQPALARVVARRARALRPHLVHVFKPKAVSGLTQALLWYQRRRGGPALVLDTDDWEGNGGWNEYERYPWWQRLICDWQERWGLEHADAITAASRTLQAQAWSHLVPPARVGYLPNGLDPDDYPGWLEADGQRMRAALGLADRPVVLLYTRFFEFSPERALGVLARLRADLPQAVLLVVGAGKFAQERRLAALADAQGLTDAVRLAGWQSLERLPGLLRAADVALFPADDNLANRAKCSVKVLETMWLGVPVVADRVGQYAEYVRDGASGLLSDPDAPESMASAALRLLRQPDLAQEFVGAARRRVTGEFSWARQVKRAEQVYTVALRTRSGCAPIR
jgi:glycosyltransferase involved in cell wall biosynthesis